MNSLMTSRSSGSAEGHSVSSSSPSVIAVAGVVFSGDEGESVVSRCFFLVAPILFCLRCR